MRKNKSTNKIKDDTEHSNHLLLSDLKSLKDAMPRPKTYAIHFRKLMLAEAEQNI